MPSPGYISERDNNTDSKKICGVFIRVEQTPLQRLGRCRRETGSPVQGLDGEQGHVTDR